jgi:hypothetical protein
MTLYEDMKDELYKKVSQLKDLDIKECFLRLIELNEWEEQNE